MANETQVIRHNVNPKVIGIQFLVREFFKLFPDQDKQFYRQLKRVIEKWNQDFTDEDFWHLVAAIGEGWKLKGISRVLTDTSYIWNLENLPIHTITLTGISPKIDQLLKEAAWNPTKFVKVWQSHPEFQTTPAAQDLVSHPQRDSFPIVVFEQNQQLKVVDGMRRTCVALLNDQTTIKSWVGRLTNLNGKMLISPDNVLYTMHLYEEFGEQDQQLLNSIKYLLIFYKTHFRNGKELVNKFVSAWLANPNLSPTARKIIDS